MTTRKELTEALRARYRSATFGGGADPADAGQLHLDPLGHAIALDQDDLFFQRVQGVTTDPFGHPSGTLGVGAEATEQNGEWSVTKAIMSRSARRLMVGQVFVPSHF